VSVKELADTFAQVTGVPVPYQFVARRPGDVAACYADTRLAKPWAGRPCSAWTACALTHGAGSPTTRTGIDGLVSWDQMPIVM
jgi:hypothetical protein